jgi:hypothetical protein
MPNDKPLEQDREGKTVRCKPVERNQLLLRPVDVEKLVGEEHAVRAIWELVGKLDLEPFLPRLARWKEKRADRCGIPRC